MEYCLDIVATTSSFCADRFILHSTCTIIARYRKEESSNAVLLLLLRGNERSLGNENLGHEYSNDNNNLSFVMDRVPLFRARNHHSTDTIRREFQQDAGQSRSMRCSSTTGCRKEGPCVEIDSLLKKQPRGTGIC